MKTNFSQSDKTSVLLMLGPFKPNTLQKRFDIKAAKEYVLRIW